MPVALDPSFLLERGLQAGGFHVLQFQVATMAMTMAMAMTMVTAMTLATEDMEA